jgi:GNAT superfamily N-acetyltransferase
MEGLQDYIVSVDTWKQTRRASGYGEAYTAWLLDLVAPHNGIIYLAEVENGVVVGCAAGILRMREPHDTLGETEYKTGRVQELYVDAAYRGLGVGKALMAETEKYFRSKGCGVAAVEVYEPNKTAHEFYRACGYREHDFNLMKRL